MKKRYVRLDRVVMVLFVLFLMCSVIYFMKVSVELKREVRLLEQVVGEKNKYIGVLEQGYYTMKGKADVCCGVCLPLPAPNKYNKSGFISGKEIGK